MAKQTYVYSGTEWVPLASEVTNLTAYQTKRLLNVVLLLLVLQQVIIELLIDLGLNHHLWVPGL